MSVNCLLLYIIIIHFKDSFYSIKFINFNINMFIRLQNFKIIRIVDYSDHKIDFGESCLS